ncbi:MAG: hypothetical protein KDB27_31875 [Planctomycetales bacterium]|nr:hypothetical protein [Planctomycetales bacterium]
MVTFRKYNMKVEFYSLTNFATTRRSLEYVIFARWPEDGCDWIHPDDVKTARRLIPGRRVFAKSQTDAEYQVYEYGEESFRALPRMQLRVPGDGLLIGDRVEVRSRLGRRRPIIARIAEMKWDQYNRRIAYRLRYRQLASSLLYGEDDFIHILPPNLPDFELETTIPVPDDETLESEYTFMPSEKPE